MSMKVKTLYPVPDVGEDDGDAGQAVLDGAAEDGVVEVEALVWPVLNVFQTEFLTKQNIILISLQYGIELISFLLCEKINIRKKHSSSNVFFVFFVFLSKNLVEMFIGAP